ncbi:efflux RND transporter periplasmic adaptor subunit [uncultured Roseibium sp.]|uniref:efflux RND transporter periplasmic adaptor subunit n=1 Tax=uncultured Roseibium sp. TaxID=1936171 RepID=UPI00321780D1
MMINSRKYKVLGASLAALALSFASITAHAQQRPVPSVTVLTAKLTDYTPTSRLPGRIRASTISEVRPQVSGVINSRLFEEGSEVKKGQELYSIESNVYAATVAAAKASVAQAQANYDLAKSDAKRAENLFSTRVGSEASRDTAVATRDAAFASLQAAEAQLDRAQIDLDRTTIRAQISGVIGLSKTTIGALVSAEQADPLTTIRTLDPIYVDVTQSVNDLLKWHSSEDQRKRLDKAEIRLLLPNGKTYGEIGHLQAAEPRVEPTTGMVTLRITFPNPQHMLLPGLYVEVLLPEGDARKTVLVPQSSVMRDTDGTANVWIVDDGKIAKRTIEISGSEGNQWVVSSGLNEGDQIVTSGFQKAQVGADVQIAPGAASDGPAEQAGAGEGE